MLLCSLAASAHLSGRMEQDRQASRSTQLASYLQDAPLSLNTKWTVYLPRQTRLSYKMTCSCTCPLIIIFCDNACVCVGACVWVCGCMYVDERVKLLLSSDLSSS